MHRCNDVKGTVSSSMTRPGRALITTMRSVALPGGPPSGGIPGPGVGVVLRCVKAAALMALFPLMAHCPLPHHRLPARLLRRLLDDRIDVAEPGIVSVRQECALAQIVSHKDHGRLARVGRPRHYPQ